MALTRSVFFMLWSISASAYLRSSCAFTASRVTGHIGVAVVCSQWRPKEMLLSRPYSTARFAGGDDDMDGLVPESENVPLNSKGQDIDAEWKKLMSGEGQPLERPKDIEVSDFDLAAKKMKSKAVTFQKSIVPNQTIEVKVPSWKRLQSDWRFWVALIVAISLVPPLFASLAPQTDVPPSIDYVVFKPSDIFFGNIAGLS